MTVILDSRYQVDDQRPIQLSFSKILSLCHFTFSHSPIGLSAFEDPDVNLSIGKIICD